MLFRLTVLYPSLSAVIAGLKGTNSPYPICLVFRKMLRESKPLKEVALHHLGTVYQAIVFVKLSYFSFDRLAPADYHRIHSPLDGTIDNMLDIPGEYYTGSSHLSIFL